MRYRMKKVVWAIDAFQVSDDRVWKNAVKAARALARVGHVRLIPVYVTLPKPPATLHASYYFHAATEIHRDALAGLKEKVGKLKIEGVAEPEVLGAHDFTTSSEVTALSEYAAEEQEADLILIGTHGRKGVSRLFIGSFAESLLLQSKVPVLIVGGAAQFVGNFDHIMFPTDFGEEAERVFDYVLGLAEQLNARITIIHVVRQPTFVPLSTATTKRSYGLLTELKQEKAIKRELGSSFVRLAAERGITADVLVRTSRTSISDAIQRSAKALQVPLVAMAAHSGRLSAAFAGSTARQVVRASRCPVWLFHEKGFAKARKRQAA